MSVNTSSSIPTAEQPKFDQALSGFIAGLVQIQEKHTRIHGFTTPGYTFTAQEGKRYIRIVKSDGSPYSRSAYCFIDKTTGDVLKAASWKAPAKHARGNIFDQSNGLKLMGPYGPAYLK